MANLGGKYFSREELLAAGFRSVGREVKVHDRASLYGVENISLGDFARIDDFAVVIATGPVSIGAHVSIHNHCILVGKNGLLLEDFTTLAPGVKLFSSSDDYGGAYLTGPTIPREFTQSTGGEIVLGRHTIIGAGSVVLPGCVLGEGCSVGALSLVKDSLESWTMYAGVPVRRLRERKRDLLELERRMKG